MNLTDGTTSYDFALLPHKMTMLRAKKTIAVRQTYTSVAVFSWGVSIVGETISLSWNAIPAAMWKQLDAFYAADTPLIWDPTLTLVPATTTYNVQMIDLEGEYLLGGYDETLATSWRGDAVMTLLILSAVVTP